MAKLTLSDLANLQNETTAVTAINSNSAAIETAIENTLSRDGRSPNQMNANLDMNHFRILNLPAPSSPNDPVRLTDIGGDVVDVDLGAIQEDIDDLQANVSVLQTEVNSVESDVTSNAAAMAAADDDLQDQIDDFSTTTDGLQTQVTALTSTVSSLNSSTDGRLDTIESSNWVSTSRIGDHQVTNAKLDQVTAASFKGNPTNSTADVQDFTVSGLTNLGTPDVTNDYLPILDASAGTLKKINITTLALGGGGGGGGDMLSSANLVEGVGGVDDAATARTNLGLEIGTDVQAFDATLDSIAALGATGKTIYTTGTDTWAETPITAFGRSLIDDAAASDGRTTMGLGGAAVLSVGSTAGTVAAGDDTRITGALPKAGGTMTGALVTAASATGGAGIRLPHGVAPTSPVNGDVWTDSSKLNFRINGTTELVTGASTTTPSPNTINGTVGVGTRFARNDHEHPESDLITEIWANVKAFGAIGNGSTDDTAAIAAAIASVAGSGFGGTVYFPPGTYKVSAPGSIGIDVNSLAAITLQGSGWLSSGIVCADGNCITLRSPSGQARHKIKDLYIHGMDLGATLSTVYVDPSCVDAGIYDCYVTGGLFGIWADGTDCRIERCFVASAYGQAAVKSTANATFLVRCKVDQSWPNGTPAKGYTVATRANSTSYSASIGGSGVGDVVSLAGTGGTYYLQCTQTGTSGGSAPALQNYAVDITDGSCKWRLVGQVGYCGLLIDSGASETHVYGSDFSGSYEHSVAQKDTNPGLSMTPFSTTIIQTTGSLTLGDTYQFIAGSNVKISMCKLTSGFKTGSASIAFESSFIGDAIVANNLFYNPGELGIDVSAGKNFTFNGNQIFRKDTGIKIAADITHFNIVGNMLAPSDKWGGGGSSKTGISIASGASDYYAIIGNDVSILSTAITDGGTGTNKTVRNNPGSTLGGRSATFNFTRDCVASSATVSYTTIGFRPRNIVFSYFYSNSTNKTPGSGHVDSSGNFVFMQPAHTSGVGTGAVIVGIASGTDRQYATFGSFLSNGFSLNWVKDGPSPAAGTIYISGIAYE